MEVITAFAMLLSAAALLARGLFLIVTLGKTDTGISLLAIGFGVIVLMVGIVDKSNTEVSVAITLIGGGVLYPFVAWIKHIKKLDH